MRLNDLLAENFGSNLDSKYGNVELRAKNKYFSEVPALGVYRNAVLVDFVSGDTLTVNNAINLLDNYGLINSWRD